MAQRKSKTTSSGAKKPAASTKTSARAALAAAKRPVATGTSGPVAKKTAAKKAAAKAGAVAREGKASDIPAKAGRAPGKRKSSSAAQAPNTFTHRTFEFLAELTDNNNKDWFAANKQRYESEVREPARALIRAMGPHIVAMSNRFVADDAKVGGSLMRVHRDVRFSADKTPYKTNVGIQFRHEQGKDVHAPGFYLHLALDGCFVGAGIWHPDAPSLAAIRERIIEQPDAWVASRAAKAFQTRFQPAGESLKRMPRGFDPEHAMAQDLRRKDHIAVANLDIASVLEPDFVRTLARSFATTSPFVQFLTSAVGLPY